MSESDHHSRAVLNCQQDGRVSFQFRCPQVWGEMEQTPDPRRRFCRGCDRSVFLCQNVTEAALRAEQGECVAVPSQLADHLETESRVIIAGRLDYKRNLATAYRIALDEREQE